MHSYPTIQFTFSIVITPPKWNQLNMNEQIQNFLKNNIIPSEFKKYVRRNFIRKCSVFRLGQENKLFKVRYTSSKGLNISLRGRIFCWDIRFVGDVAY